MSTTLDVAESRLNVKGVSAVARRRELLQAPRVSVDFEVLPATSLSSAPALSTTALAAELENLRSGAPKL